MHVPLLVGQTFTEQSHVVIHKTSDALELSALQLQYIVPNSKINLFCIDSVEFLGLTAVDVYTDPPHQGEIFVDGGIRFQKGVRYSVAFGWFQMREGGTGQIVVNNTSSTLLVLSKDFLITRGRLAQSMQALNISPTGNNKL